MPEKNPMTIDNAAEYKRVLSGLSAVEGIATFDLEGIPSIDAAGVQLLVSAMRESLLTNRALRLIGRLSSDFRWGVSMIGLVEKDCESGEELEKIIKAVL